MPSLEHFPRRTIATPPLLPATQHFANTTIPDAPYPGLPGDAGVHAGRAAYNALPLRILPFNVFTVAFHLILPTACTFFAVNGCDAI